MQGELRSLLLAAGPMRKLDLPELRHRLPAGQRAAARFFDSPRLNDSVLLKRLVDDIIRSDTLPADEPVSMMVLLPQASASGPAGKTGTETTYAIHTMQHPAQYRRWLEQEDLGATPVDVEKLRILHAAPTFSPAVVALGLHRSALSAPVCYGHMRADSRASIDVHLRARLRALISSLVTRSAGEVESMIDSFVQILLWSATEAAVGLTSLVQALKLPAGAGWDFFSAWIGLTIYECEAAGLKTRVSGLTTWLDTAVPREGLRRDDLKTLASLARDNHRRVSAVWKYLICIYRDYRIAYEALVFNGDTKLFCRFLSEAPTFFPRIGEIIGRLEHCVLVWADATSSGRERVLPYAALFTLLHDLGYVLAGPGGLQDGSKHLPMRKPVSLSSASPGKRLVAEP